MKSEAPALLWFLCPLLLGTQTAVDGLVLGGMLFGTTAAASAGTAVLRRWLAPELHVAAFVAILTALVASGALLLQGSRAPASGVAFATLLLAGHGAPFARHCLDAGPRIADGLRATLHAGTGFTALATLLGALRSGLEAAGIVAAAPVTFIALGLALAAWNLRPPSPQHP